MPAEQPTAILEGRRVYVGNLLYAVKPDEIETLLETNGFGGFEHIHISIDPISSRNPGYCFVDFKTRAEAEEVLLSLRGSIRGRPIKVGPCHPKQQGSNMTGPSFQRWGDWNSQKREDGRNEGSRGQGPRHALDHFDDFSRSPTKRRIYLGGLRKMIDQTHNQEEIQQILKGFNPTAIGKRITPHESTKTRKGHYHYCFVDFQTEEEAAAAVKALNGSHAPWGQLRVTLAKGPPADLGGDLWSKADTPKDPFTKLMTSSDWRRRD